MTAFDRVHRLNLTTGTLTWGVISSLAGADPTTFGLIEWLLIFGVGVCVPLTLWLLAPHLFLGPFVSIHRLTAYGYIPCTGLLTFSLLMDLGLWASALAAPWVAFTLLLALAGGFRMLRKGLVLDPEQVIDIGCCCLPIGAAWLVASRLGLQPLGFVEPLVTLTAVHFHFIPLGLIVMGFIQGALVSGSGIQRAWDNLVDGLTVLAIPMIALGLTFSPELEFAGVVTLAGALVLFLVRASSRLHSIRSPAPRLLLAISLGAASCSTMLFLAYGFGKFLTLPWLDVPTMAATHGVLNTFGFVFLGVVALAVQRRQHPLEAERGSDCHILKLSHTPEPRKEQRA